MKYEDEEFPGEVTCIEDTDVEVNASCIEVQMFGSGRDPKTKSSIQELKLYELFTHEVWQAIEDNYCLKTLPVLSLSGSA